MDQHNKDGRPLGRAIIHIMRHGQGMHNVDRNYSLPDPPLTEVGQQQALAASRTMPKPDVLIVSPMTRTIQTSLLAFSLGDGTQKPEVPVQIWPDLREAHGEICCQGVSRAELASRYPGLDFSECHDDWDYPEHSEEGAVARAERVRRRLKDIAGQYERVAVVTHRGFIAYLVGGETFKTSESRTYRFPEREEVQENRIRVNKDTGREQDFGPTLLVETD